MDTILPQEQFTPAQRDLIGNIDAAARYALRSDIESINTAMCEGILNDIDRHLTPVDGPNALATVETGLILAERFLAAIEDKVLSGLSPDPDEALRCARAHADINESTRAVKRLVVVGLQTLDDHFASIGESKRFEILSDIYVQRIESSLSAIAEGQKQNQAYIDALLQDFGRRRQQGGSSPSP